jgi:histidine triad (HIT) family protein
MDKDCVFCRIIAGEIPSRKIYEDDLIFAFHDINPVAPVHFLVIPKIHAGSLNDVDSGNIGYVSRIFEEIPKMAAALGIAGDGYRVVANTGKNGQQSVDHLHFHVIGGRKLTWSF